MEPKLSLTLYFPIETRDSDTTLTLSASPSLLVSISLLWRGRGLPEKLKSLEPPSPVSSELVIGTIS